MGVTGAMVDRLCTVRSELVDRIDGESTTLEVVGPWIKCRLAPPTSRETRDDVAMGYERLYTVIINSKDVNGVLSDIEDGDQIQISSAVFGDDQTEYELVGVIEPIRSKRKLIMYRAAIRRRTHR